MLENKNDVNGFFLPFGCLNVLLQLDPDDVAHALLLYEEIVTERITWEEAFEKTETCGERCGICLLCEYAYSGKYPLDGVSKGV